MFNKNKKMFLVSLIIPVFSFFYLELAYQFILSDLITYLTYNLVNLSSFASSLINKTVFNLIIEWVHYTLLLGTFILVFKYRADKIEKGNPNFIEDGFLEIFNLNKEVG